VDVRLGYYRVELNEWTHYPITGVGPGNFVYRFYEYAPAVKETLPFPSNVLTISGEEAYLVILAEQGAVGLALFLGYLALSWADLRRRFPDDERSDQLQAATAAGFVVACIGALFLAEQYYPPLWFLAALGASMASRAGRVPDAELSLTAVRPGTARVTWRSRYGRAGPGGHRPTRGHPGPRWPGTPRMRLAAPPPRSRYGKRQPRGDDPPGSPRISGCRIRGSRYGESGSPT
jgi:hypothetical protein